MKEQFDRIASEFFAAIERGDLESVRDIYAPDAQIWHNVTRRTQTRDENLRLLGLFIARVTDRRYEIQSREFFAGGFVQRHLLHGTSASGEKLELPACLVVHFAEGRIERLYEYLDSAAVRSIFP
ncbi:MAG TPA: nuclear transport factor 2 family protein [Candidatus Limnocylindrales bacterium]|nr:nuclear transport factor 2 family protein [Candidatus Limnocylindrales bacterium]